MTAILPSHRDETETGQIRAEPDLSASDRLSPESYETDLPAGLRPASSYPPFTARHTMHRVRSCLGRSLVIPKVRKVRAPYR